MYQIPQQGRLNSVWVAESVSASPPCALALCTAHCWQVTGRSGCAAAVAPPTGKYNRPRVIAEAPTSVVLDFVSALRRFVVDLADNANNKDLQACARRPQRFSIYSVRWHRSVIGNDTQCCTRLQPCPYVHMRAHVYDKQAIGVRDSHKKAFQTPLPGQCPAHR